VEGREAQDQSHGIAPRVARLHGALDEAHARLTAHDPDTIRAQIEITEIPAPTGEEGQRAAWIAERFESLRLEDVRIDAAGNVIGTRAGRRPGAGVVVCAHLDTVFPREAIGSVSREGQRLFAPGIGDNGRGLAAMVALAGVIDGETLVSQAAVHFVATTGEEGAGDLRGMKHFFDGNGEARACIALDGTGDDRIVHRAVGSRRLRVTFGGPGGHSWSDFGVVNPLHACGIAIADIHALSLPRDPAALTVARAAGGLSVNSIPRSAWFEVDARSTEDAPIRELDTAVRRIARSAMAMVNARRRGGTPELTLQIDVIGDRPGGSIAASDTLVEIAAAATRAVGRTPVLASASTDANIPLSRGIPAIAIGGGGDGGDVHTLTEWYENVDGPRGISRALTIVMAAAG
jgi:acetylornithine deacetylase/succinyl-diaminopimelate desuccinylase-like protein